MKKEVKAKQEKIWEAIEMPIRRELVKYPELDNKAVLRKAKEIADEIKANLRSQGVVIKVEGELSSFAYISEVDFNAKTEIQQSMIRGGYVLTEPLI